jgi:hypothetical protein
MVTVLDLTERLVPLKKVANVEGGEWVGPCPFCKAGTNRFHVWPFHSKSATGRYWCRQCGRSGDAIQFLQDFEGLSYREACKALNIEPDSSTSARSKPKLQTWQPKEAVLPAEKWQIQAKKFINHCHKVLMLSKDGQAYLKSRGLTLETARHFKLGWNGKDQWDHLQAWGLDPEVNPETGKPKKLWLPKGLVLPCFSGDKVSRIKIRRINWQPDDKLPKFIAVKSSSSKPMFLGTGDRAIVVTEAEIDALLIWQEAKSLVDVVALGSVAVKPDKETFRVLKQSPAILVALDYDEAGAQGWLWWAENFEHSLRWPVPDGKDIGDYFTAGGDLRTWVLAGLLESGLIKLPGESGQEQEAGVKAEPEARPDQKSRVEPEPESEVSLQGQQGQSSHQNKKRITKTISNSKQEQIKQLKEELYRILPRLKGHVDFVQKRLWFDLPGISNKDVEQWELFGKAESLFWAILELQAG